MNKLTVVLSFIVIILLVLQLEEQEMNYDSSSYNSDHFNEVNCD